MWTRHRQKRESCFWLILLACRPPWSPWVEAPRGRGENWAPSGRGDFGSREKNPLNKHLLESLHFSLGLMEKGFLVLYFLYYIFRADLDPTCDQGLKREQRTRAEKVWRGSWVGGSAPRRHHEFKSGPRHFPVA